MINDDKNKDDKPAWEELTLDLAVLLPSKKTKKICTKKVSDAKAPASCKSSPDSIVSVMKKVKISFKDESLGKKKTFLTNFRQTT